MFDDDDINECYKSIKESYPEIYNYGSKYCTFRLDCEYFCGYTPDEFDPFSPERENVLEELIRLEEEKLGFLRVENNLAKYSNELIVKKIKKYINGNFVVGNSIGMQGIGKSTFFKENFPNYSFDVDKELNYGKYLNIREEIQIRKRYNNKIEGLLDLRESIFFDGMVHTVERRKGVYKRKKEQGNELFLFFFTSDVKTCIQRLVKRRKLNLQRTKPFAEPVNYLVELELPINKEYELEEGVDLLFLIDEFGNFKNAYPFGKFNDLLF